MTPERRAELRRLLEQAAPSELLALRRNETDGDIDWLVVRAVSTDVAICELREADGPGHKALAQLIAATVNALPALLDAADELERVREKIEVVALALAFAATGPEKGDPVKLAGLCAEKLRAVLEAPKEGERLKRQPDLAGKRCWEAQQELERLRVEIERITGKTDWMLEPDAAKALAPQLNEADTLRRWFEEIRGNLRDALEPPKGDPG